MTIDDTPPKSFRPATDKPKAKRPWTIEYRGLHCFTIKVWREWSVFRRYESEKQRDQALVALMENHKRIFEFRKGNTDEK